MKRKLLLGTVAAILVIAFAMPAFAAISDSDKQEIDGLLTQIAELRKQVIDKYVESGNITQDQGNYIKDNIDRATEYQRENDAYVYGSGYGCGGPGSGMMYGRGMMNGYGNGYGMMSGYSNSI